MNGNPFAISYTHANALAIRATWPLSTLSIPEALADCENRSAMALHEIRDTRRKNLAVAVQESGSQAALAKRLDVEPSYISQMLNGHRGIGDETARKIERLTRKPRAWMDTAHPEVWGQMIVAKAAGSPIFTSDDKTALRQWLESEIGKLTDDELEYIIPIVQKLRSRPPAPPGDSTP